MNLNGIMLGTEDTKKLGEFYTKIFGKPAWDMDGWYGFAVGDGNLAIGPHSEVKGTNKEPGRIMLIITTDDVQGDFDRIKGLGAKVVSEPYKPEMANESEEDMGEMWLATFADPDGNYFQLSSPWVGDGKDK